MPFIIDRTRPAPVFITKKIGGGDKLQDKEIVAGTESIVVESDQGFDALNSVTIIPNPLLEYYANSVIKVRSELIDDIVIFNEEVTTE